MPSQIRMIRMRLGFESAYEDSEVRDEALRAYLRLGLQPIYDREVEVLMNLFCVLPGLAWRWCVRNFFAPCKKACQTHHFYGEDVGWMDSTCRSFQVFAIASTSCFPFTAVDRVSGRVYILFVLGDFDSPQTHCWGNDRHNICGFLASVAKKNGLQEVLEVLQLVAKHEGTIMVSLLHDIAC